MIHIKGAIVVEGKYDKIKLAGIVDCPVITTDGFGVFRSREKRALIRSFAENGGITVLTDSDAAGFKIRGYIKGFVSRGEVRCAYIPDIYGKEKRKRKPSAEGKLGVEGISPEIIAEALIKAGAVSEDPTPERKVTRADLYDDGFFGRDNSSVKRAELLKMLGLPERLSTSGLVDVINCVLGYEGYKKAADKLK